ncbi:phosphoenolpyruvate carboxykinase (GTP) [Frondihabitans australicus]|uniref:Phosphoenolpyruvate carboxykinase [GTP] n=1 Tax=Frondihabitans australicus TaxID=386892 RepID=A0A495ICQ1_9MICO|nr:phosphoenolpyruvate carboxykinase (GTP) [Frondihabitans australicus]RKR73410.1 phosphoenolpyruvate carboxykinase (GTP) [Frondihabitans australicus]
MISNPNPRYRTTENVVAGAPRVRLDAWVAEIAALTQPDRVVWCDGSDAERERLTAEMVAEGKLIALDPVKRPNSYLARTSDDDVARVESRTFICSIDEADAGPTNNWRAPSVMKQELTDLFRGSMRGRTMYVVPFAMGPDGSELTRLGVEVTDSPYVVLSMAIMTRVGARVLREIEAGTPWVATLHSVGYPLVDADGQTRDDVEWPSNEMKYIAQFPDSREIWSFGSGYGGNALLAKKCFALRIASVMARDEGWLAEHMLLIRLNSPKGRSYHVAAAFPSACGKTNLAMLKPTLPGWSVETIGDDIAWMKKGSDGRLHAINPEAGFFGVAPGTGPTSNPTAIDTVASDTIFTNVALTDDGDVWWEGLTDEPPAHLIDWRGDDWVAGSETPAAHPNSRFTVSLDNCPQLAADAHESVPIDAILFGGRRATNLPLVAQARDWTHGVFLGATISSEQTAAAEGTVGELRRDPFAMLPFCGYDMADHWSHWLDVGRELGRRAPAIFQVNWFRKGDDGGFLWPGFGENSRVLDWIIRRVEKEVAFVESPAGRLPRPGDLDLDGIDVSDDALEQLFHIDADAWLDELGLTEEFFDTFGERVHPDLRGVLRSLRYELQREARIHAARTLVESAGGSLAARESDEAAA